MEPPKITGKEIVFGQEPYDRHFSRQLNSTSPEVHYLNMLKLPPNNVLATATYILTGLVLGQNSLELCVNLQATNRFSLQKDTEENEFINFENILKSDSETPFTNSMLLENNACLNVSIKIRTSLQPMLKLVSSSAKFLYTYF